MHTRLPISNTTGQYSGQCSGGGRSPLCYVAPVVFCLFEDGLGTWPAFHSLRFFRSLHVLPEGDTSHNPS